MIIGLTGPNASGKGEAALYLKSKGFEYYSLSDVLREEGKKTGIDPTRENLIRLGNNIRKDKGPAVLAIKIARRLSSGTKDCVIDSIRNPAEIAELRKLGNFILIGIDAPAEVRFRRSLDRKRRGDARTLKEFMKKEGRENRGNPENQQLNNCLKMADVTISNDSTIKEFKAGIDEALKKNKKT